MRSYGVDSSPVAVAIAQAKCAHAVAADVLGLAKHLVSSIKPENIPKGEFWEWAFGSETLEGLCAIREGLLQMELTDEAVLLRALCLGCLHGPRNRDRNSASYFSNQMPRTFASKPEYAVRFWSERGLVPINVDVQKVLERKARRALKFATATPNRPANVRLGDSSELGGLSHLGEPFDVLITSPPYFGLQTYVEDQWLRNWFVGEQLPETMDDRDTVAYHLVPRAANMLAAGEQDEAWHTERRGLGTLRTSFQLDSRSRFTDTGFL